ncbi:MAG TPA: hypothetical protein VJ044_08170 [Candidatus Hodarchaeales archaeon]|nr:hypothetical protein [Candidatus Hodarchaeales archaeon]
MDKFVVRDDSWHYRYWWWLQHEFGGHSQEPTNLCSYFWILVGKTFMVGIVGLVAILFIIVIAVVYAIPTLIAFVRHKPMPWDEEQKRKKSKQKKQPGLVRSFMIAKKRRVCPLIVIERTSRDRNGGESYF